MKFYKRKQRKHFQQIATDLFHEWAKLPDYEPLDEDMVICLVGKIRDTLIAQNNLVLERLNEIKAVNYKCKGLDEHWASDAIESLILHSSGHLPLTSEAE